LPAITGNPIRVSGSHRPQAALAHHDAYAACFIRERRIVLESALFRNPPLLSLILTHEIFHFVWPRLGNPRRDEYAALIEAEMRKKVSGELGESAEIRKGRLAPPQQGRAWRDYLCESFCDTAAWLFSGVRHNEAFTLAKPWSDRRRSWFETLAQPFRC